MSRSRTGPKSSTSPQTAPPDGRRHPISVIAQAPAAPVDRRSACVTEGLSSILHPGATAGGFFSVSWSGGGLGGMVGGFGDGGSGGASDRHSTPSIHFGRQHFGSGGGADVGGRASKMSGDVAAPAKAAMARLEADAWTHEAAAAAIENAQQESSVRSDGPLGVTKRFGLRRPVLTERPTGAARSCSARHGHGRCRCVDAWGSEVSPGCLL